jgi:siroheme synthase (precorrin-2 oxidase/ferrochelatase)
MNVETGASAALQRKSDVLIIGGGSAGHRRINIQPVEPDRMTAG